MDVSLIDSCPRLITGGYDLDFVDPPPESLQCPVCLLPFRDPTLLSCCGHKGCASCIGRIKASGRPCPICQQTFEVQQLDKEHQREVLDLRVFCFNKGEGCRWEGALRDFETHLFQECKQRPPEVLSLNLIRKMAIRIDQLEATHQKIHQEDQTKITAVQAKLATFEKAHEEDKAKFSQEMQHLIERTISLQEDHEKLATNTEKARQENQAKLCKQVQQLLQEERTSLQDIQMKLKATEKGHLESQTKLSQQIQQLRKQNASLNEEKLKLTKRMEELEDQVKHS